VQREAIARFAKSEGFELAGESVKVETGKGADALARPRRPHLAAALAEAKRRKCAVAVAKLDRLSRNVHLLRPIRPFCIALVSTCSWLATDVASFL
jgi:DNA invertase Pin-like site-specific DNA recombinase